MQRSSMLASGFRPFIQKMVLQSSPLEAPITTVAGLAGAQVPTPKTESAGAVQLFLLLQTTGDGLLSCPRRLGMSSRGQQSALRKMLDRRAAFSRLPMLSRFPACSTCSCLPLEVMYKKAATACCRLETSEIQAHGRHGMGANLMRPRSPGCTHPAGLMYFRGASQ